MRKFWVPVAAVGLALGASTVGWGAARASAAGVSTSCATTECPPESHTFRVRNPDGSYVWIKATGTGSGGESWVQDYERYGATLTADGFRLVARGCGWKADPCVISDPNSPQS